MVVFAGPGVAGAIRNQFNQVTNTVDSGTEGNNFISAEEKAYREAMKTVASKEAKDWTLDEQKAAATDIAKNGTSSPVYAKAKAAMDAGIKFSTKLTNGKMLEYRIVGINHDDLADDCSKAGLTFEIINGLGKNGTMTSSVDTETGWAGCCARQELNSGSLWSLLPSSIQNRTVLVKKQTAFQNGNKEPSLTKDRVFLLSSTEIYGDIGNDGTQYEYYQEKRVNSSNCSGAALNNTRWTRSTTRKWGDYFDLVGSEGRYYQISGHAIDGSYAFNPAFCF